MRFALIDDNRVEAQPQLKGLCSCCSNPVIAKCGSQKIWHWAHKSKTDCDDWWEPENGVASSLEKQLPERLARSIVA